MCIKGTIHTFLMFVYGVVVFFSCLFFFSHSSHVILGMPSPLFPYHCLSSVCQTERDASLMSKMELLFLQSEPYFSAFWVF